MDAAFALEVLDKAPYVTVSFTRPDGSPYGVPLSLARTDEKTFYFHCAPEGEKLDCIAANPMVALSAVTRCTPTVGPKDGSFTLQYKSAMAIGRAELVKDNPEKIMALRAICQRFLPSHMAAFDAAIERSLDRTAVVKIKTIEGIDYLTLRAKMSFTSQTRGFFSWYFAVCLTSLTLAANFT